VTNYHVFLCIVGFLSVIALGRSVFLAVRTRAIEADELETGRLIRASRTPVTFWVDIVYRCLIAITILIAMAITIFRAVSSP
jgi:hypothetical protein